MKPTTTTSFAQMVYRKCKALRRKRPKTVSGVFCCTTLTAHNDGSDFGDSETEYDDFSYSTPNPSSPLSWKSTNRRSFYEARPAVVKGHDSTHGNPSTKDELLALNNAIQRSSQLPGTWYYSSNHVMVNTERKKQVVAPLNRLKELDELARAQAKAMADSDALFHSEPYQLHCSFSLPSRIIGENVACGATIREIHANMLLCETQFNNMVNTRYTHFGIGTAKGSDGQLFLCQVFRG